MKTPHIPYGKKLPSLLILLVLTLSVLNVLNVSIIDVSAVESPAIYIEPATTVDPALMPGKNYTISIKTDYNGSDIWGYEFSLSYDPDVLHGGINRTDTWIGDGTTTAFNTTRTPVVPESEKVYVNQTRMTKPANYIINYISGEIKLTLTATDTWIGDGTTTAFNTTRTPVVPESEKVYVNQTFMDRDFNYTIDYDTGEITFIKTPPGVGAEIEATYQYPPGVGAEIKAMYLYDGVANGDLITQDKNIFAQFIPGTFDNEAGNLSKTGGFFFYIFPPPYLTSGPGTLANVTFTVVGKGSTNITLGLDTLLLGRTGPPDYPLYNIVDAATMLDHIQHGFFSNKVTGSIAGNVTDASTGLSISGATVTAVGPETRSTTTAENGTYSLDEVLVGDYTVTASAAGYHSGSKQVTVNETVPTTVDFALEPILVFGWIEGKVTDNKTGSSIVDATVKADGFMGFTNETGYYSIEVAAPGTYTVTASMLGYYDDVETGVSVSEGGATTTVNFTLQPIVGWIDGTVKDAPTGASVKGANVTAGDYYATTNPSGYYLIADVPVGTYNVTASADGYYSASKPATVKKDEPTTVNFDIEPFLGAINGTVTDKVTNLPIANATVTTTPGNYSATTDASGTYVISEVPVGTYQRVDASANGYFGANTGKIVVTSGRTTTVNFKLTRMRHDVAIALTIPAEATQGENVTFSVSLTDNGNYNETFTLTVIVKETGTTILEKTITLAINVHTIEKVDFDTSTFEPDTYTIRAEAILATAKDDKPDNNQREATITIKPKTGSIAGNVTDASTGLPIAGSTVTAVGPETRSTTTAENGTYSLDEVLLGDYTVTASAAGYYNNSKPATVTENATTTVDLTLTPLPGTISGKVTDSVTGDPIAGATLTVDGISAATNSSGGYTISDVPAGTYTVKVSADGYQNSSQTDVTVVAGETTIVDFELTPSQPLNLLLYAGVAAIAIIGMAAIAVYIIKVRKTKPT